MTHRKFICGRRRGWGTDRVGKNAFLEKKVLWNETWDMPLFRNTLSERFANLQFSYFGVWLTIFVRSRPFWININKSRFLVMWGYFEKKSWCFTIKKNMIILEDANTNYKNLSNTPIIIVHVLENIRRSSRRQVGSPKMNKIGLKKKQQQQTNRNVRRDVTALIGWQRSHHWHPVMTRQKRCFYKGQSLTWARIFVVN